MSRPDPHPPLKPLHPDTALSPAKLAKMESLGTDVLKHSLTPGQKDCLKTGLMGLYSTDIIEFMFSATVVRMLTPCRAKS
jgi:hypothetical protein